MIGAEIELLESDIPETDVPSAEQKARQKAAEDMIAAAEKVFGNTKINDPRVDRKKVEELARFAAEEGAAEGPSGFLSFLTQLERHSTLQGKRSFLDRAWYAMRQIEAQRVISDLKSGR